MRRLCQAALVAALLAAPAAAHEMTPIIADVAVEDDGVAVIGMAVNAEALIAGVSADHVDTSDSPVAAEYDRLRALPGPELAEAFDAAGPGFAGQVMATFGGRPAELRYLAITPGEDGDPAFARTSRVTLSAPVPAGAETMTWALDPALGDSVIRVLEEPGGPVIHSAYVAAGSDSGEIPLANAPPASAWRVFSDYVVAGFQHIIPLGLDHILFVIGLFLLADRMRDLLILVTMFTIAHSLTLALAMLRIVTLPASVVEPLIAASIVFVAVENVWRVPALERLRAPVVFGFGLLHGLGFAGVLTEFGLDPGQFLLSLAGFNVGVELGQLAVILGCFIAVGAFRRASWYRRAVSIPVSLAVAAVGAYWFVERVL